MQKSFWMKRRAREKHDDDVEEEETGDEKCREECSSLLFDFSTIRIKVQHVYRVKTHVRAPKGKGNSGKSSNRSGGGCDASVVMHAIHREKGFKFPKSF